MPITRAYKTSGILGGATTNGETLVADSSATTGLRWQGNFAAGKNKIINGDFNIWQRGTSISLTNGNQVYCADRFLISSSFSAGTSSFSQQTFTPGTAPVAGYEGQYFGRLTCGSTASNFSLYQKIEDVRTFAGQTITVSFWIKSSSTAQIQVYLNQNFGSGGSANVDYYAGAQVLSSTWTRVTKTVSLSSISGKTIGTNSNLLVGFYYDSGTINSATVDIWGVQVEAGNVATAFQTATGTLAGELAACQRYCVKITAASGNGYERVGTSLGYNSASQWIIVNLPVEMRVYPTSMTTSGGFSVWNANRTSLTSLALSTTPGGSKFNINLSANANQNGFNYFEFENNANGYVLFSAEL